MASSFVRVQQGHELIHGTQGRPHKTRCAWPGSWEALCRKWAGFRGGVRLRSRRAWAASGPAGALEDGHGVAHSDQGAPQRLAVVAKKRGPQSAVLLVPPQGTARPGEGGGMQAWWV